MGKKPKMPAIPPPPPPAPTAPDFSAALANRSQNRGMRSAMGGTYLTQGMKLGGGAGRSMLGA